MAKFFEILIIFLFIVNNLIAQKPIVSTAFGKISGYENNGLHIFKGIPFAAPPLGELRWKEPQDPTKWEGILSCVDFAASPMQREPKPFSCWTEEFIAPPSPLSEDCLYLNVWTKPSTQKKPVVVWIYGGGFNSGSAACAIYDGKYYAKNDVVFVSINYRVNIFGFFAHPELSAESNGKGFANFGLLDQLHALKWVQNNIEAFGGDPNNVCIMGQSAGSFSVQALVASPLSKGLFHKAIGHSGGILGTNRSITLSQAHANGEKLVSQVKSKDFDEFRSLSSKELLEKVSKFNPSYVPVLDNYYLPSNLTSYFEAGKHNDVNVLTGWVTGDGALFGSSKISKEDFSLQLAKNYPKSLPEISKVFPFENDDLATESNGKLRKLSFGAIPAVMWGKYNQSATYIYEFSHVPVRKPDFPDFGAFHTADVPFALHSLDTWDRPWGDSDAEVEKLMSAYWLNFIKTGNPNGNGLPKWEKYEPKKQFVFELNSNPKITEKLYADEINALLKEGSKL
jgi:para-nitrobenzyl esterase